MTVKELKDIFDDFKKNDFGHLRRKVDWLFYFAIATLTGLVVNLCLKLL